MEDQVSHINDLEGLNSELEGFLSDLHGREETLAARIVALEEELAGVRASSEAAMGRFAQKEAALSAALAELKSLLSQENAKALATATERDTLARKLDEATNLIEEERSKSAEKDLYVSSSRSVLKEKEAEAEKLWRSMEELKSALAFERAAVKDREEQIHRAAKSREELERRLEQAAQESARSEEGFALKVDLLKNEVREQARRSEDLERRLAAAGSRLEEAAAETVNKEKILAEARSALSEKEAVLKDANQRIRDLLKELGTMKNSSGREDAERAREIAASLSARVEELEAQLGESAARSLEKFRASQAALSESQSALRAREEENSSLRVRENTLLRELADAEEKWKLASAQLHNAFSKLRCAENENEINSGRLKTLEEERNKFRAAAIKAEAAASAMASQEAMARDGEAAGLMAALEEQAGKYTALLRKYDDLVLANESLTVEKNSVLAESEALRESLKNIENGAAGAAGEEKARHAEFAAKLRDAANLLKKKELEIEAAAAARASAEAEASSLRSRLAAAEAVAADADGEEKTHYARLAERLHEAEILLKKRGFELDASAQARAGLNVELDELRKRLAEAEAEAASLSGTEKERHTELAARLREAQGLLKKKEIELEAAAESRSGLESEVESLRFRLSEVEEEAAAAAGAEKERYAELSEKMHNADALLKKKEFELEEARSALSGLESECSLLRRSRAELGEKYAREIQSENEMLKAAQARVVERDATIARLSVTEDQLKKEADALRREKQTLASMMRKKSASADPTRVSEAERMLQEKESRLVKLRAELENTRAEKAELQGREKELREELKARPYRAMLREAEDKLFIKEKMLSDMSVRMKKIGRDFEELKGRGQSAGAPGYLPDFEELVAGVAHQIANSISIIRSHAEFCAEAPESEGARESLDVIVRNIVALQKKIDTIMNFSRPVIPQRSPERLASVVSETLAALRSSGRLKGIKVHQKGGEKLKPVSLDRVRFAAAVEQLVSNAIEAMPGGGELTVSLSSAKGKQRLEITDNGEGVERKNIGAVFHPFFTTRPGKMGLGLTLARNVIRAHGGSLELASEPGKGSTATIELPEV